MCTQFDGSYNKIKPLLFERLVETEHIPVRGWSVSRHAVQTAFIGDFMSLPIRQCGPNPAGLLRPCLAQEDRV